MGNNCSAKPRPINTTGIHEDMNPTQLSNYQTGKMHENRGELQQAEIFYMQALRANQHSAMSYCGLGNCQLKKGDYMRALGYYQNAIAHDPNCKHAYNGLGIIYENANNDRKAILNFNKAIQIDPQFSYPYNGLGNLHMARKNYNEALQNYQTAEKLEPYNPIILANIACCQMNLGKTEEALGTFKRVQDIINQDQAITPTNKFYLRAKLKQYSQAFEKADHKQIHTLTTTQNASLQRQPIM